MSKSEMQNEQEREMERWETEWKRTKGLNYF